MKSRLSRQLRRLTLLGLIVVGSMSTVAVTQAQELDGNSRSGDVASEWCGWGTHDSTPLAINHSKPLDEKENRSRSRTAFGFEQSLATVAAAATAKVGISFEQIIEPFAMVSKHGSSSSEEINQFEGWWNNLFNANSPQSTAESDASIDEAKMTMPSFIVSQRNVYIPFVDFETRDKTKGDLVPAGDANSQGYGIDGFTHMATRDPLRSKLDSIAKEEPVDTNQNDDLNRVFAKPFPVEKQPVNRLVGASPMIISIDEPYLPDYHANRNLPSWMPLSLASKPFCMRYDSMDLAYDPMWNETPETKASTQTALLQASADCLLDEWIWHVSQALESGSTFRQALAPRSIGEDFAWLTKESQPVSAKATTFLAKLWPEVPAKPAPARQLLARAEAIEADSNDRAARQQLTDAIAKVKQWWVNAQAIQQDWLRIADTNSIHNQSR